MNSEEFNREVLKIILFIILAVAMLCLLIAAFYFNRTAGAALIAIYIVSACYAVRRKKIKEQETRTRMSENESDGYKQYKEIEKAKEEEIARKRAENERLMKEAQKKRAAEKKAALEKLNGYTEAFDEEAAEAFMKYISPKNDAHTSSVVKIVNPRRIEIHTFRDELEWKALDDDYYREHHYEDCASCTLDASGIKIQEHEWTRKLSVEE